MSLQAKKQYAARVEVRINAAVSTGVMIGDYTVSFDNTFNGQPIVCALIGTNSADSSSQWIGITWYDLTAFSVKIRLRATGATVAAGTYYLDVLAMSRG